MKTRHALLVLVLLAWPAMLVIAQDSQPAPADDDSAAMQQQFDRGIENMIGQLNKQYELDEQQQGPVRDMVQQHAKAFLERNRDQLVDVMQRGRAMQQYMRQSGGSLDAVPADIQKDMAERALTMMDAMQTSLSAFEEDFKAVLTPEQQEKLAENQKKMQIGMAMGRARLKLMAAQPTDEDTATLAPERPAPDANAGSTDNAPAAGAAAAPRQARQARARAVGADWDAYVQDFIRRYHLDEMQKVQALDILKRYKGKAQELAATSQPASQPAAPRSGPISLDEFRSRLSTAGAQRRPMTDLFEQMKAELERIPTAVQKEMARQPSSQPSGAKPQE